MPVPYEKSHLTYEDQVELLRSRGLTVPDRTAALRLLRAVGYYRLSAYVYPFRDMLPESAQRVASPTHYRAETIRAVSVATSQRPSTMKGSARWLCGK